MGCKAVFLDRDGTINIEKNHLYRIEDLEFIEGVPEAIRLLNISGYKVIIITNQAGVAKGYYTEADVLKLHEYIASELAKSGARVDDFYYCPHHPTEGKDEYRRVCGCRKPATGMLEAAMEKYGISPEDSWVIGDRATDIQAGNKLGINTVLVETGYGKEEFSGGRTIRKANIMEAVRYIISEAYLHRY